MAVSLKRPVKKGAAARRRQPLDSLEWVDPSSLKANAYNPNHVSPPEMALLKTSILEDGWTQPIVARSDNEIVDGFHRWTLASTDEEVAAMTGGLVPVVRLDRASADQMMSTIRHNRARGAHAVLKMADIVRALVDDEGLSFEEVGARLGMDEEEVDRLYDSGGMTQRGSAEDFGRGWVPGEP